MIVNEGSSLTIVNEQMSLRIVNETTSFIKNNHFAKQPFKKSLNFEFKFKDAEQEE